MTYQGLGWKIGVGRQQKDQVDHSATFHRKICVHFTRFSINKLTELLLIHLKCCILHFLMTYTCIYIYVLSEPLNFDKEGVAPQLPCTKVLMIQYNIIAKQITKVTETLVSVSLRQITSGCTTSHCVEKQTFRSRITWRGTPSFRQERERTMQ